MDELIDNFSKHINKLISNKLGSKIRNLARAKTSYRTEEDYSRLENNIQIVIESYLSNLKDNDYKEIANNIFNSFVEEDDKNLIKAVNFYKRTYEYYQEIKLRKKFFKWRKTALKLKMINNFLLEETKNFDKNNLIKKDINKIYKSKKEENKIKENYDLINEQKNMENIDDNINEIKYENAQFYKKMNENVEDYIKKNNNNINKEIYKFNNELNDNDDDYKEEFSEELDYNKLYSKNN